MQITVVQSCPNRANFPSLKLSSLSLSCVPDMIFFEAHTIHLLVKSILLLLFLAPIFLRHRNSTDSPGTKEATKWRLSFFLPKGEKKKMSSSPYYQCCQMGHFRDCPSSGGGRKCYQAHHGYNTYKTWNLIGRPSLGLLFFRTLPSFATSGNPACYFSFFLQFSPGEKVKKKKTTPTDGGGSCREKRGKKSSHFCPFFFQPPRR